MTIASKIASELTKLKTNLTNSHTAVLDNGGTQTSAQKYKYNGIVYVGGEVPEGAEILETMEILNAEDGYDLIRIHDEENMGSSVWLRAGDLVNNYREEEHEEPEE